MRKFFVVAAFAMFATANAYAYSDAYAGSGADADKWKLEPTIGPTIGIDNWGGTQFSMNVKVGKGENWSGLVGLNFGGANAAQIKLGIVFDYPFYLKFSEENDFSIGPTVDAGLKFGAGGGRGTSVDFLNIGFGCRTAYRINEVFGVVADLLHFQTSFVGWTKGAGVNSGFAMAYDMQLGIFYLF
jgi:hypothetical protein